MSTMQDQSKPNIFGMQLGTPAMLAVSMAPEEVAMLYFTTFDMRQRFMVHGFMFAFHFLVNGMTPKPQNVFGDAAWISATSLFAKYMGATDLQAMAILGANSFATMIFRENINMPPPPQK